MASHTWGQGRDAHALGFPISKLLDVMDILLLKIFRRGLECLPPQSPSLAPETQNQNSAALGSRPPVQWPQLVPGVILPMTFPLPNLMQIKGPLF